MFHLIFKLTLILITLTALALGGIHSQPNDDSDLRTLIVPSPDCATPCWQGIQIGVTTREQATQILQVNPWVDHIYQSTLAVTWRWSSAHPLEFDGTKDGLLGLNGDIVQRIRIQTLIPFGAIWLLLDRPKSGMLVRPLSFFSAYQVASYPRQMQAINPLECPITPEQLWSMPITLGIGALDASDVIDSTGYNVYQVSNWWPRLHYC